MASHAVQFATAITRFPAPSAVNGLRAEDQGVPDYQLMMRHHVDYRAALRDAGAVVIELPMLDDYPDAQFVEDTALCLPGLAIMMRPGAESRRGEVAPMRQALSLIFDDIEDITTGFIEAGDILVTEREVLVGRSARTDQDGVDALQAILNRHGYSMRVVDTPPDVLHFKTDCGLIDDTTIIATRRLARSGCFDGYDVKLIPDGEEPAANMIRYNDTILMADGFPRTEAMLKAEGYTVTAIGNSECAKIDGGMSCLSLRF
ncbi:MAG: dimethylarginine dimethylaminohydrolase [Alphaproteobacteria bacterium]|nr:dimethylarginine dimethylaminohydrolase [Alphaproteobacteria bacterium]